MPTPDQVEKTRQQKAEEAQRERELADSDLAWLMSDKRGRRFMWRLLADAGLTTLSYVPQDAYQTAFREGQRNIAIALSARLHRACPDRMSEMQKEVQAHVRPDPSSARS